MTANFTINALFAVLFGSFAWNSLPRGWRFLRVGWSALSKDAENQGDEIDIEKQRDMSISSSFLIAGIAWMIGGLLSAGLTIMFVVFAILNIGILPS